MTTRTTMELKRLARENLIGNYIPVIFAMLTAFFMPIALLGPFTPRKIGKLSFEWIIPALAAFILAVLGQLLVVCVVRIHILLARKQRLVYKDMYWAFFNQPDRFLSAALLLAAVFILPAVPAAFGMYYLAVQNTHAGKILLASAAVVFLAAEIYIAYMLELVYPLCIDRPQMSAVEGFRMSCTLMRGNKMRFLRLQLSFIGWYLLGVCSAGIGFLWIIPYIGQTSANFYLDLTGQLDQAQQDGGTDYEDGV